MKTKVILSVLVLFAVSCLLSAVCCSAAVPSLINYQGVLKDSTGVPYDGNATMVFSIWDDSTNGNKLWEETQAVVSVSHGLFNVLLGSSIAIPESVFAQPNSWLQVIANGSQLSPRRQIVSVGYALHSGFTDTAEYALSAPPDDDWDIDTAGFNVYRLTGGVGIGTFPQYELDVAGTAQMTGFKMPTGASDGYVLTSDASGGGTWQVAQGGIGGSGTANYIPKFADATTLDNSVIYETAGNVGIGTATPQGKLDINGPLAVAGDVGTAGQILQSQGTGTTPVWASPSWANTSLSNLSSVAINESLLPFTSNAYDIGSSTLRFKTAYFSRTVDIDISSIASAHAIDIKHSGMGKSLTIRQLNSGNGSNAIFVTNAGTGRTFEFQQTNSSNGNDMMYLYNAGTGRFIFATNGAYLSNGGVWTDASSRKYKKDIRNLTTAEATSALRQLNPVVFKYKRTDEEHVGFIGEDVPDLVATKDRKGLSPMDIVAVLTKMVQEQQERISILEKQIAELKK